VSCTSAFRNEGVQVQTVSCTHRFEEASPEPYDLVVDTIGGDYELRSLPLLKRSGHFAHILNSGFLYQ
jgi:NADPH:quinone reductase-like Zn-dependent oxidoreductase